MTTLEIVFVLFLVGLLATMALLNAGAAVQAYTLAAQRAGQRQMTIRYANPIDNTQTCVRVLAPNPVQNTWAVVSDTCGGGQ